MKVVVVGLGLIGGSIALELREKLEAEVFGMDKNPAHLDQAAQLGLIDGVYEFEDLHQADVVILAIPVDGIADLLPKVLDVVSEDALVFDVGSTKVNIARSVEDHVKRKCFVAAHPIAGTENSGPSAAHIGLFESKVNIICDKDKSADRALTRAMRIFHILGMRTIFMNSEEHDKHIAYVSHISHISSFMLGKTVLEIEKDEKHIFDMAGSGFESTVRLAKSSPKMWSPIFAQNKENILCALDSYIENLQEFRALIAAEDRDGMRESMQETNHIKSVLKGIQNIQKI